MLDSRLRKNLDLTLILLTLLIVTMGIVTLYSATKLSPGRYYQKQTVWFSLGLVVMVIAASLDYTRLARFSRSFYVFNLVLLAFVLKFAEARKGSNRWIDIGSFQFQPSELSKIIIILCLAAFLVRHLEHLHKLPTLLLSFLYVGLPTALIFKQPDLGTSLVLVAIWFGMVYIAGARVLHLALFLCTGILLFAGMWHFNILQKYQKDRLQVFINPELDPKDAGYHVIQSRIAIGSGQVWGKGLGQGSQAHGRFIPENHTDFIFTVVGEEGGFVVSSLLVLLYGALLLRGVMTMAQAEEDYGKLVATGIVSMYTFHIIVNIGMTIGMMPITGVPLPLFSYGGSNLLLNMTAIGLLLGIGMRRHRLIF